MAEYIERESIYKTLSMENPFGWNNNDLAELFREAKPADVAPVRHGKWKYYHKQNIAVCTECSFERNLDANFGRAVSCPNCGAKMDLEG